MSELKFTDEESKVWKAAHAPNATPDQWNFFLLECQRRNLIPGTHVVFSLTNASERDAAGNKVYTKKVTLITTINALRLLADRYSRKYPEMAYVGHGPFKYHYNTENGELTTEIPRGAIPHAVSVELYRKDWLKPLVSVARFEAYAKYYGKEQARRLSDMWETRGEEQLAKCCLAGGLREVAPEENGGLYISEELESQLPEVQEVAGKTLAVVPESLNAPAVNQTPAETIEKKEVKQEEVVKESPKVDNPTPKVLQPPEQHSLFANSESEAPQTTLPPAEPLPASEPVLQPSEPPAASATTTSNDVQASDEVCKANINKIVKIHHDLIADKTLKYLGPGEDMQKYLLRITGKQRVKFMSVAEWELAFASFEGKSNAEILAMVKG